MSQIDIVTTDATEAPELTSVDEVTALLDPTATGKVLENLEPEDWCAFGEA